MVAEAHSVNAPAVVVTFYPNPHVFLHSIAEPHYLSTTEERAALLGELGIDIVITLPFDQDLASMGPLEFIETLNRHLNMHSLWVGENFSMGYKQKGNVAFLKRISKKFGFDVTAIAPVKVGEIIVSSSAIRSLLGKGDVQQAANLLGRLYLVSGKVIRGDRRGHSLGFPTANLEIHADRILPAKGVYATRIVIGDQRLPAASNIGIRPTFKDSCYYPRIETHILDFSHDIYGQTLQVEFLRYLRPEIKFNNVQELLEQIQQDTDQVREVFSYEFSTPGLPA